MSDQLDPNAIAANVIQHNIEAFIETAKGILKGSSDMIRLHIDKTYKTYLNNIIEKYSKTKSFLLRGEPVPLDQFYVPLNVHSHKQIINTPGIAELQNISSRVIITGSAGCGKSMMMRHLLLDSIIANNKVPILIELRQFNASDTDLKSLIQETLQVHKFKLDSDYIDKALKAGHFILFLDGYDEVISARRNQVMKYIDAFVKYNDKNMVVISSRPDNELEGWAEFSLVKICALTLSQAQELVNKLPYDEELKTKFLSELTSGLFQKHESFLSNPLLLSIMLLTYGQSANIPNKLNVFYNQAYEALFERHDALKGGFKRERLTPLDIQDFAILFAAFCLQAYDKRKLEFTHTDALDIIAKSQKITGLQCKKEDYLTDLIQSVCLLVTDGLQIVYSHRSFQEYFAARFIADARADIQEQLIKKYAQTSRRDNVFHLLYEMRPHIIEQFYLIPTLDMMFAAIGVKKKIGISHYMKYMKMTFSHFELRGDRISLAAGKHFDFIDVAHFALNHFGPLVGWSRFNEKREARAALIRKHCMNTDGHSLNLKTYPQVDNFLKEYSALKGFYSKEMLITLEKIREVLKKKAIIEEKSLEAILSNK